MPLALRHLSARRLRVVNCGKLGNPRSTKAFPPSSPIWHSKRSSVVSLSSNALRTLCHHPGSSPHSAGQVGALRSPMVLLCGLRVLPEKDVAPLRATANGLTVFLPLQSRDCLICASVSIG
eukprot:scaffold5951_cov191-Pinguiococcus_pyrenoidosus.AAC.2